jgi:DNA polymerase elongation subunit (family B)
LKKTNGKIIDLTIAQLKTLIEEKCTVSANGVLYIKPALKFGIIPQFLDKMYKRRVEVKGEMKKNKKKAKAIDEEIKQLE